MSYNQLFFHRILIVWTHFKSGGQKWGRQGRKKSLKDISEILTECFHSCASPFSFFGTLPLKVMSMRASFKFDSLVDVFGYLVSLNDRCSAIQFFFYFFTHSHSTTIGCTICVRLKVKRTFQVGTPQKLSRGKETEDEQNS